MISSPEIMAKKKPPADANLAEPEPEQTVYSFECQSPKNQLNFAGKGVSELDLATKLPTQSLDEVNYF